MIDESFQEASTDSVEYYSDFNPKGEEREPIEPIAYTTTRAKDDRRSKVLENDEKEAKEFLEGLRDFLSSNDFKTQINETARIHGIPPKKLAVSFFGKIAGTIADTLGVAINFSHATLDFVIHLISTILLGGVGLLCKIADALVSVVTLNRTNKAF